MRQPHATSDAMVQCNSHIAISTVSEFLISDARMGASQRCTAITRFDMDENMVISYIVFFHGNVHDCNSDQNLIMITSNFMIKISPGTTVHAA